MLLFFFFRVCYIFRVCTCYIYIYIYDIQFSQVTPDEFELSIAEELLRLQSSDSEFKATLRDLKITAAKEVDVGSGRKAIILYVPYKLHKSFKAIQHRLVRELEKKFSGSHVVVIAQRSILGKSYARDQKTKGLRPRSRTLTAVQDAILDDIVYPTEIEGKRTRCKVDGSKVMKVLLSDKDRANVETRIGTYASIYQKLTNKQVQFVFEH